MKSFIRNLSAPTEFCIVILVFFWWGIIGSVRQFVSHLTHTAQPEQVSNGVVLAVVTMQLLVIAFALWIGSIRGWSLASFGARVSWKGTAMGVLLFIVTVVAIIFFIVLTNIIAPGLRGTTEAGVKASGLTLPFILLMALVNPIYEEVLGTGYFIYALQRFGMFPAVLASALFRTFLHSYKGIDAIVIVLPMGLVFGFWYWRWRRLWPLVFAHIIIDIWSLFAA
jgi:membrane protease YdiL (CAAX protease family)